MRARLAAPVPLSTEVRGRMKRSSEMTAAKKCGPCAQEGPYGERHQRAQVEMAYAPLLGCSREFLASSMDRITVLCLT